MRFINRFKLKSLQAKINQFTLETFQCFIEINCVHFLCGILYCPYFFLFFLLSQRKERRNCDYNVLHMNMKKCVHFFSLSSVVLLRFLFDKNRHLFSFKFTVYRGLYILPIKFNLQNKLYVRMNIFTENYVNIRKRERERKVYEQDRRIGKNRRTLKQTMQLTRAAIFKEKKMNYSPAHHKWVHNNSLLPIVIGKHYIFHSMRK